MAKSKDPVKPLFPLKHEFVSSLDAYIHQAMMLSNAVRTFCDMGSKDNIGVFKEKLKERLDEFEKASGA